MHLKVYVLETHKLSTLETVVSQNRTELLLLNLNIRLRIDRYVTFLFLFYIYIACIAMMQNFSFACVRFVDQISSYYCWMHSAIIHCASNTFLYEIY